MVRLQTRTLHWRSTPEVPRPRLPVGGRAAGVSLGESEIRLVAAWSHARPYRVSWGDLLLAGTLIRLTKWHCAQAREKILNAIYDKIAIETYLINFN